MVIYLFRSLISKELDMKPFCLAFTLAAVLLTAGLHSAQAQVYTQQQMSTQTHGNMSVWRRDAELRRHSNGSHTEAPTNEDLKFQRGARLIKQGLATMEFATREWPTAFWMAHTRVDASLSSEQEERRIRMEGMQKQRAFFAEQVARRSAKWGDMADMMSIATVICVEAYTGKTVSNEGFRKQSQLFREAWLKDSFYQGQTTSEKQEAFESVLLASTYSWYLDTIKGDREGARQKASRFFDQWFGDTETVLCDYQPYLST